MALSPLPPDGALQGSEVLSAPFPWYGGKSRAAPLIWQLFGRVQNYVESFAGSLAVLLGNPYPPPLETVNDRDAFICNVWRALQADPEGVAAVCDRPPNEADQDAVHTWLVTQRATFTARLMGDPDYYDVKVAGRWLYGIACWIGSGWCDGNGPWHSVDGHLVRTESREHGVRRQRLQLSTPGQGVHRQLLHLGNPGRGVHKKRVHLSTPGHGVHKTRATLQTWFAALQARLRWVRVCCGDWSRVLGPSVTSGLGLTAVLLDPPYSAEETRTAALYGVEDLRVAHAVRAWCAAHGQDPKLRIVLCGYGTAHDALLKAGWQRYAWLPQGGFGNMGDNQARRNKRREILWASPACLPLTPRRGR